MVKRWGFKTSPQCCFHRLEVESQQRNQLHPSLMQAHLYPYLSETSHHQHYSGIWTYIRLWRRGDWTVLWRIRGHHDNIPKQDIIIARDDWTAKVGPDVYQDWSVTGDRFCIRETNDSLLRHLEFARSHQLTLTNTLHQHKPSRTATWYALPGQEHNQIDFILAW